MRNIYLTGFMGTGKSTVAQELSKLLQVKIIDMDKALTEQFNMPISKVFEEQDMLMSLDSAHIGSKVIISLAVVTAVMTALAYRALKCKKQIDTV